jgi:hypothetical protein
MKETLEQAALKLYPRLINDPYNPIEDDNKESRDIWIEGAKWQQEQDKNKYSEEDMKKAYTEGASIVLRYYENYPFIDKNKWFEQFKKK